MIGGYYLQMIEHRLLMAKWDKKFVIFARSVLTQKLIWFTTAMRGRRVLQGPGTDLIEYFWMTENEYFMWRLSQ